MACPCYKKCPDRKTMREEHGTPEAFSDAVWNASDCLMITPDEARAAVDKYRAGYAMAPEAMPEPPKESP